MTKLDKLSIFLMKASSLIAVLIVLSAVMARCQGVDTHIVRTYTFDRIRISTDTIEAITDVIITPTTTTIQRDTVSYVFCCDQATVYDAFIPHIDNDGQPYVEHMLQYTPRSHDFTLGNSFTLYERIECAGPPNPRQILRPVQASH